MTRRSGRVVLLLTLAVLVIAAACTPAKPPTPPAPTPGRNIAYYLVQDFDFPPDMDEFRSPGPFTQQINSGLGSASQFLNSNGSVSLAVENACGCGAGSGFYTNLFRLGDLNTIRLFTAPGASPTFIGLVFDVDGDGQYGDWDANGQETGASTDELWQGPYTQGGQVFADDNREFALDFVTFATLGELKAGLEPGINANTLVGVVVIVEPDPFLGGTDAYSVATSLSINGNELLT